LAHEQLALQWAGQQWVLRADRSLHWPDQQALLVADVHLGKAASFRRLGVPVPTGPSGRTLQRLFAALQATRARRLIVLGDLVHSARALTPTLHASVMQARAALPDVVWELVQGNHDSASGRLPTAWGLLEHGAALHLGGIRLCHDPAQAASTTPMPALAGHVHPCVHLGRGVDRLRLPCFHFNAERGLLPAFGEFTGMHAVACGPGDQAFVTTGEEVRALHLSR
jgi:uncharacterized protein